MVQGERKLDLKKILDVVPRFEQLPQQALANNLRESNKRDQQSPEELVPDLVAFVAPASLGNMLV